MTLAVMGYHFQRKISELSEAMQTVQYSSDIVPEHWKNDRGKRSGVDPSFRLLS
jgi:hypothetical protein